MRTSILSKKLKAEKPKEEPKQKKLDLWDFVDIVINKKIPYDPITFKGYDPYMMNKIVGINPMTLDAVNTLNRYSNQIPKSANYRFYSNLIPKRSFLGKYNDVYVTSAKKDSKQLVRCKAITELTNAGSTDRLYLLNKLSDDQLKLLDAYIEQL